MIAVLLKVTVVLSAGLVGARIASRGSAARRHLIVLTSIVAALLVPALVRVVPSVALTTPWLPAPAVATGL